MAPESSSSSPRVQNAVAIVGFGCHLPGARTPVQFWTLLCEGVDATSEIPSDRPDYRRPGEFGRLITQRGGFVRHLQDFDPYFFGISPREAAGFDPQQRFLLEAAWRAAEDAGVASAQLQQSRTGVFVGLCSDDYHELLQEQAPNAEFQAIFSSVRSNGSGRLSYALGLSGPSVTVDTACSSSLVCVHLAVRSIQAGDCELAFAGGANAILRPSVTQAYMRGGLLSPDGRCQAFSENANGFVRSEGAGIVLLKSLSRAVEDGDRIYAVIRGSSVNNDGGSSPFMTPSRQGQAEVIRAACAEAKISPADLVYVEAHGTGTPTGDPIEVNALSDVMGEERAASSPLRIGSCKTNIGHLEGAAGIVGLMKAALAVYHGVIPASLHAAELNAQIPWSDIPVSVQQTLTSWPEGKPKLAGVSSFGIYGTNAHVVLGGAGVEEQASAVESPGSHVLPISARDEVSLKELAARWRWHLTESPAPAADLCYTAALRRTHFDYRLAVSGHTREQLADALGGWLAGNTDPVAVSGRVCVEENRKPVLVFSGVGSLWPGMALELYDRYPIFRESLQRTGAALERLSGRRVVEELRSDWASSRLELLEIGQPALFQVQVALSELWKSWGVEPGVVIGHSLGEIAAAHVAGALSLEDAALVVLARSQLMAAATTRGGMLACGLSIAEGEQLIRGYEDRVAVGVVNGNRSIVLSGDSTALDEIARTLEGTGVFCRRVNTHAPTHSPLVDSILGEFARRIATIHPREACIPLYSTVSGARIDGAELTPDYWVRNVRGRVMFAQAMERMLDEGERLFIEVSPHPLLITPMQEDAAERSCSCWFVPSMRRRQDSERCMLESFSRLYAAGYPVRWTPHIAAGAKHADVPGHPFRRERVWLNSEGDGRHAEQAFARVARPGAHALLPLRFDPAEKPGVHVWEGTLDAADHPFLMQHLAQGQPILPAAAYYDLAYAIGVEILGAGPKVLSNIQLRKALFLSREGTTRIQAVFAPSLSGSFSVRFFSAKHRRGEPGGWQLCCEMTLRNGDAAPPPSPVQDREFIECAMPVTSTEFYALTGPLGLEYGPLFQGVRQAWHREEESLAELEMPEPLKHEIGFHVHPAFLDAAVQLPLLTMARMAPEAKAILPVSVDEVYFARPVGANERVWAHCRTHGLQYDATLTGEDGTVLFRVRNATCHELATSTTKRAPAAEAGWMYRSQWEPSVIPEYAAAPGRWLIVGDPADAKLLGAQLELHGQTWNSLSVEGPLDSAIKRFAAAQDFPWRGLVYLSAPDNSTGGNSPTAQKKLCGGFLNLIQAAARLLAASPVRVFVAGRGVNLVEPGNDVDVSVGPLFGLARVAANEFPQFQVTIVDLDPGERGFDGLLSEMLSGSRELETAYRNGKRYVARIGRLRLDQFGRRRKRVRLGPEHDRSYKVVSPDPGSLDDLTLETAARRAPGEGEIEVRVAAGGLNFLDVLRSLNMGPAQTTGPASFGMEFSGEVIRVGAAVTEFRAGDRIMALTSPGEMCFQPWVTIAARFALPVPKSFTMEQAASCLVAYQTAWYALVELGRLRAGDRILIHAAAGGVGLAAIYVAQLFGAEIFATAGSPEKRDYLRKLGVPHVMDSRTLEFADQTLATTGGRGVDLVLNSISGEAIAKSIATLAPGGRFLEIGKRDIYANSAIELFPFRKNLSFYAIDMVGLTAAREGLVLRITSEVRDRLVNGDLPPLPLTAFPASRAADAFRYMAQSRQIGKVVVTFDEQEVEAEIPEERLVRADATYLITGGMTGIGLECARWLVARGARHLVLVGRRTPSAAETETIANIRDGGIDVMTTVQDVSSREGVRRVIDAIDRDLPPLAGVIHSAGIARDGVLERLQWSQFEDVFAPKIQGSWNLHTELLDRDLDFFVLFSSVASSLGSPGQGNYAAANAFLDSLGEYRTSRGLPVMTINWGPWTGIGMLVRHKLRPAPIFGEGIRAEQGIACLSELLARNCAHATVMSADWKVWRKESPGFAAKPLFMDLRKEMTGAESAVEKSQDGIAGELAGLSRAEGLGLIRARLNKEVVRVLRISEDRLDTHADLQRLGLDSLMAVELSSLLQRSLGISVPLMILLKGTHLEELATVLYDQIAPSIRATPASEEGPVAPTVFAPQGLVQSDTTLSRIRPDAWVIQEGGPGPALFCLGGPNEWIFIAQQLGDDQRVIGVIPTAVQTERRPRIEDFGASAVKVIRECQPSGPYMLAGWSVWGLVAFEAAQQLTAASDEVHALAIVDTFLPLTSRVTKVKQLAAWARLERRRMAYHVRKLRDEEGLLTTGYLKKRLDSLMRYRVLPMIQATLAREKPVDEIRSSKDLGELLLAANLSYQAMPYSGRVLLCTAADRHEGTVRDYVDGWKDVLTGDMDVLTLTGDHVTMFDPENVQPLVEKLRALLITDEAARTVDRARAPIMSERASS